jgi:lipoprotein-anchoring transpeptidase ErfK/SrfK
MTSTLKPRYGRITAFSASVLVTGVALLGGVGVLPSGGDPSFTAAVAPSRVARDLETEGAIALAGERGTVAEQPAPQDVPSDRSASQDPSSTAVPPDSGEGRRVVFDIGDQRVWLVKADGTVARTYLVSGSIYDNLDPGTYEVYSRSRNAVGIEDSGTMEYMVRFAHGATAAIGFHDIPVYRGERVQTRDELGTPLSHGCVRQWRPDAKALWDFAPLGTKVVVTA